MSRIYGLLLLLLLILVPPAAAAPGVTILCYHDIGTDSRNFYTVSKQDLIAQFNYLKQEGYQPISLQQYQAAMAGNGRLPAKPVLLTFDDGYRSFYQEVYPLLKEYRYPAVLAVVTFWQTAGKPADVGELVSWQELREMEQSGLVTIASHSHNLHRQVAANAYGDSGAAGATLPYRDRQFESVRDYELRIGQDLEEAQKVFRQELGHAVEVLVWPYGEYTLPGMEAARSKGFTVFLGLGGGFNPIGSEKSVLEARRGIIFGKPDIKTFARFVQNGGDLGLPLQAARVSVERIYDPGSLRLTDSNLRQLADRYRSLGINTVFLQAYLEDDTGIAGVYFPTAAASVKTEVFDHIARRFKAEGLAVYAVMPLLSEWVKDSAGQESAKRLYTDLASYTALDGVVFQADQQADSITAEEKAKLTALNIELSQQVRQFRPYAKFVRTVSYPGESAYSPAIFASYDYVLAQPGPAGMVSAADMAAYADAVRQPSLAGKLIMDVPTYNLAAKQWFADKEIKEYVKRLTAKGVVSFAFFPDAMFSENSRILVP